MREQQNITDPPFSEKYDPCLTGSLIKKRRKQLGMTQPELAQQVGLSVPSISKYETGKISGMTYKLLKDFANALDIPVSVLTESRSVEDAELIAQNADALRGSGKGNDYTRAVAETSVRTASFHEGAVYSPQTPSMKAIPLIGNSAAGAPIFAIDEMDEYVYIQQNENVDFAVRIQGDSMINARIHDGDILFAKRQSSVQNGEIAIVAIDDAPDESYVTTKRFYKYGKTILLRSENPLHKDIEITNNSGKAVRIIGKAAYIKAYVY